MLAAAREGAQGPGDRGGPAAPLHPAARPDDEFQAAFNDADMVYVAPVYAAGEEPIEGVDADGAGRGAEASAAIAPSARSQTPGALAAGSFADDRRRGDMVDLPRRGRHHQMGGGAGRCDRGERRGGWHEQCIPSSSSEVGDPDWALDFAGDHTGGGVEAGASLADFIWFRTAGRPNGWCAGRY